MHTATEMVPPAGHRAPLSEPTQRLILRGVSWATYQQLLDDFKESHAAHFAYDRGVLEIMVLSTKRERPNRTLALLVEVLAEELNMDVQRLGSTTFTREDLAKGFEPDSCFYIQNESRARGKEAIDLAVDLPPDLVIEIDITSPSLNKLPIYAPIGVPEVWRYDGRQVQMFALTKEQYVSVEQSVVFPRLSGTVASDFLEQSTQLPSTTWLRRVRKWARDQKKARRRTRKSAAR
ncbi:MAG: Uma2 family endonuclease [Candidatus Binatia bacterium]